MGITCTFIAIEQKQVINRGTYQIDWQDFCNKVTAEYRLPIIMVTFLAFGLGEANDMLNEYIKNCFYIIVERALD